MPISLRILVAILAVTGTVLWIVKVERQRHAGPTTSTETRKGGPVRVGRLGGDVPIAPITDTTLPPKAPSKPHVISLEELLACNRLTHVVDWDEEQRKEKEQRERKEREEREHPTPKAPEFVKDLHVGDFGYVNYLNSYRGRLFVTRGQWLGGNIRIRRLLKGVAIFCEQNPLVYTSEETSDSDSDAIPVVEQERVESGGVH